MKKTPKIIINYFLRKFKYQIVKVKKYQLPFDMDKGFRDIYKKSKPFTKTNAERLYAMYKAAEYVAKANIPGAIVECGVYRGGSTMSAILKLVQMKKTDKQVYLYDTYTGMDEPGERDVTVKRDDPAWTRWKSAQKDGYNTWCYASVEEVRENMISTGYPEDKFVFIKGKVEETIPDQMPDKIAVLRLDTDFYSSTAHEMKYLFPLLSPGGVLIIDDYGCFKGARDAVDEYFAESGHKILLHRVDGSGRVGIKI